MNLLRINKYSNLCTPISHSLKVNQLILPAQIITRSYVIGNKSQQTFTSSFQIAKKFQLLKYSTTTSPPPPPPPSHDKNYKGKIILNRISRAFTFSLSVALVIAASGIALLVLYLIITELFFPTGDTTTFNKAVNLIQKNTEAQKVLNFPAGERLKAYGFVAADKWVRNRPVQSVKRKGDDGKDHLYMKFKVETSTGNYGVVTLEQIDNSLWSTKFKYIALDVPGRKTVYIIAPPRPKIAPSIGKGTGFLGLNWGPKKD
ncbi:TIM21 [Candida oxycetoniae]|uniref:Mitochondrial import inner membrane translocase subunit Tim21 n=1 Tax=Candida oxycetoniae TaxID=497107 RepID=A0AAI9SXR4_9ASCO|nr:TIM21 [Candida oxycetoniae]KAI3404942.2 TIM21 [Candida oxycetoniae]